MTVYFEELTGGSIDFEPARSTRRYLMHGVPDVLPSGDYFSYVASVALVQIPTTHFVAALGGTLFRNDIQIHENVYGRHYELTASYGRVKREVGAYQISIDQTGGTANVKVGTRISGWGPNGGGPYLDTNGSQEPEPTTDERRSNKGVIGKDGEFIYGVDIPVEQTRLTINYRHPAMVLTREYIRRVGRLVGFVNNDEFLGYQAGEVLFLGGQFTETNTESNATYSFAISYNVWDGDDLTVAEIDIKEKKGWDVISPIYAEDIDNGHGIRKVQYIEIIRPAGREWKDFGGPDGFGWGGTDPDHEY